MSTFPFCLNTSTIRPTPLLEKVRIAGQLGFDAIEPWNDEIDAYLADGGTIDELKTALSDAGLKVVSVIALHGWITAEGDAYDRALDDCKRRMDQAAALGSPFIVASPPREVVDLAHAARRYAELLKLGREHGIKPAMEFLGFVEGIKDVASAWSIVEGSQDPDASLVADVFHLLRGGGSVDDLLHVPGDRMAIFHINDLPAAPPLAEQTDADRVMVGDGTADLPRVLANLRAIGYRGPLSLELFNRDLWEADPEEVCRTGLDRIRSLVES